MMYRFKLFLILAYSLPVFTSALAQSPTGATSLGDLSQWHQARDSGPYNLVRIGDRLFFSADNDASGRELWVSDGTVAGTQFLKDINPGLDGSEPDNLNELDGHLVFTANDGAGGLWVSDGTPEGTRLIADGTRHPRLEVTELLVFDGYAYVSGSDDEHGSEVWRYSVKHDKLMQVADLVPGSGDASPGKFNIVAGRLLFNSEAGLHVIEPGIPGARPFEPPGVDELTITTSDAFVEFNGNYYFQAYSPATGNELWRTDGSAEGTSLVVDLRAGSGSSSPDLMVTYRERLYFVAQTLSFGRQLFVTDGTPAGTQLVREQRYDESLSSKPALSLQSSSTSRLSEVEWSDLVPSDPGPSDLKSPYMPVSEPWPLHIRNMEVHDNVLYFVGEDAVTNYLLWRSDGTAAGSEVLRWPEQIDSRVWFSTPFTLFDQQFVGGYTDYTGFELWRIVDGKSVEPVGEFHPGWGHGFTGYWELGDSFFFTGSTPETGAELWEFDGSIESRRLIANVMPDDSADSFINKLVDVDGTVYFLGPGDRRNDAAIWRTDGTPGNTVRLQEFESQSDEERHLWRVQTEALTSIQSRAVFDVSRSYNSDLVGEWAVSGDEVLKTSDKRLGYKVSMGDRAFATRNGDLWSTGGIDGSVNRVVAINDGTYNSSAHFINASDNYLWFFSGNQQQGHGVWKSDGTSKGTVLAAGFTSCNGYSSCFALDTVGDDFYFLNVSDGVNLWRTGESGTTLLARFGPILLGNDILYAESARIGDKLLLIVRPLTGGRDLWVTDGSVNGTQRLGNIAPNTYNAWPHMAGADDAAYFTGFDQTNGLTLWRSDGTKAGTGVVIDLEPGFDFSPLEWLTAHNGAVYFVGRKASGGKEIWKIDGNRAVQVTELMPGTLSADPQWLTSVGGRLFFLAYVPGQGRELMVLDE